MVKKTKPRSPTTMEDVDTHGRGDEHMIYVSRSLVETWYDRDSTFHASVSDILGFGYDMFQRTYSIRFTELGNTLRDTDGQVKRILDHSTENGSAYSRIERSINMDDAMISEIRKWANDALTNSSVIVELLIAYGMIHCDQSNFSDDTHFDVFEQHMERFMRKEQMISDG